MKTLTREEYLNEAKKELAKIFKQTANVKIHKKIKLLVKRNFSSNRAKVCHIFVKTCLEHMKHPKNRKFIPKALLCEKTRCVLWEDKMCVL